MVSKAVMPLAAPPAYRVKLVPELIVVDAHGLPVSSAHVVEIVFPGIMTETSLGRINTIAGPGIANIMVDDITHQGIPLGCAGSPKHILLQASTHAYILTFAILPGTGERYN